MATERLRYDMVALLVLLSLALSGVLTEREVLAGFGSPVVLIVAWVFELTPEGIKRESEIDRTQPTSAPTGHRLDRVIIAFLAVAAGRAHWTNSSCAHCRTSR